MPGVFRSCRSWYPTLDARLFQQGRPAPEEALDAQKSRDLMGEKCALWIICCGPALNESCRSSAVDRLMGGSDPKLPPPPLQVRFFSPKASHSRTQRQYQEEIEGEQGVLLVQS